MRSAFQYTATFRRYAFKSELNDVGQIELYYDELKNSIKNELAQRDSPNTLDNMVERAIMIDEKFYVRRMEQGKERGGSY